MGEGVMNINVLREECVLLIHFPPKHSVGFIKVAYELATSVHYGGLEITSLLCGTYYM